jgi:hypothetical protein
MFQPTTDGPVRAEFRTLLASLREYFAAEPAAVSVNTERFGTLSREDVSRLSAMVADGRA